jgi:energy-coupling factor transport system permease protein
MTAGMVGLCVGVYGLLDTSAPRFLAFPAILAGSLLCCGGLALGGRRVMRTHYRPDPWLRAEWLVAGCGVVTAALLCLRPAATPAQLDPLFYPLHLPPLPLVPTLAILLGAAAGVIAPPPAAGSAGSSPTHVAGRAEPYARQRVTA